MHSDTIILICQSIENITMPSDTPKTINIASVLGRNAYNKVDDEMKLGNTSLITISIWMIIKEQDSWAPEKKIHIIWLNNITEYGF